MNGDPRQSPESVRTGLPTWAGRCTRTVFGLALLITASSGSAITPMTTAQLVEHCRAYDSEPSSLDSVICTHYVQGFVAGAVATDDRVSRNVVEELAESEGFAERYYEIRFGTRVQEYGPTYFAEFCIPDEIPLIDVVEKVVFDFNEPGFLDGSTELARDAVYKALRKDYACQ